MGYIASLIFALFTLMNRPYVNRHDNVLHTVAQLSVSATLFIILSLRDGNLGIKQANIWLITFALTPLAVALFIIRSEICTTLKTKFFFGFPTCVSKTLMLMPRVKGTPKCSPERRVSAAKSDAAAVAHHEDVDALMLTEDTDDCGQSVSSIEPMAPAANAGKN